MIKTIMTPWLLAGAMCVSLATAVQASESWYTADQASQGHTLFNNHCAECHRPDLTGALGPALVGKPFSQRWGGKPVEALYKFEHSQMPANSPGSLSADVLLPITAYILQKNGLPAGSEPLTETTAAKLTLTK